ncbi:hypothetical protein DTW90_18510 [Neorhizobium sp. P12A]|uniref:portal protein n=1 Tax=Neorhizobium sp. P12A TaxID=2268027 RepID=UPI0011ED6DBE|nr:hypothetical protein [Neorhizobium sp. P12A]KAA0697424.1 hypothetical protein DTW90_18510 [Neorhizobium sp. P12A]
MNQTGYSVGNGPVPGPSTAAVQGSQQIADHARLKRQFTEYLSIKDAEIKEQKEARRYHHGSQYTDKQIKTLNQRRQPVVTYNRISRKINALIGFLEKMKTDPRAYPRTPQHDEGAEIATAVLRYVCDEQDWTSKSPICGQNGAVDGIGGVELIIEKGDMGDPEIGLEVVDPSGFFYDPRSLKPDFSDARYMGSAKWADLEAAIEMFPDREEDLRASVETGNDLSSNPDSDRVWINGTENNRRIRIVDHWYIKNGDWYWCIYTGSIILAEGLSYVKDEKKRTICKYIMYSANIDQDGDRYGFVRNMKSSQDEINQRRSKALHTLNSRRVIIEQGSVADVEQVRKEAARPDGVIEIAPGTTPPQFDDNARGQELQGQMAFLEDAKNEIENYGFNPALIGQGVQDMSGRAIQLQQQSGIAELGPYTLAFRGWKIRVYRAVWCAVKEHWTSERWIRVTDDQKLAQFFAINQLTIDQRTGQPVISNSIGALDVDIIVDEGPDEINMQADAYDTLTIMARSGQQIPAEVMIELSSLQSSVKQRVLGMLQQAKQAQQQDPQKQALLAAQLDETNSAAVLKRAQAQKAIADAGTPKPQPGGPTDLDVAKAVADIRNVNANTAKTFADARKSNVEAALKPVQAANEAARTRQQSQQNLT